MNMYPSPEYTSMHVNLKNLPLWTLSKCINGIRNSYSQKSRYFFNINCMFNNFIYNFNLNKKGSLTVQNINIRLDVIYI